MRGLFAILGLAVLVGCSSDPAALTQVPGPNPPPLPGPNPPPPPNPNPSPTQVAFARTDGAPAPRDLAVDGDGSSVVVGDFDDTATLGAGGPNEVTFDAPDLFPDSYVARYNADGSLAWASHITGERMEEARAVALLADGSCLVTGNYENTAVFGAGEANETTLNAPASSPGITRRNVFVALYNADGTLAWARDVARGRIVFPAAIATYVDGSFVLTGQMTSETTFGPGDANETVFANPARDMFVARCNADASLVWARSGGGPLFDRGTAVATFADGSCVVAGVMTGAAVFGAGEANETALNSAGTQDTFVARYNADGTLAWAAGAGGTEFSATTGVGSRADGSCLVLGYFNQTKVFGAGGPNETTLNADLTDVFIASYNVDGSLAWVRREGGPGSDIAHDIAMFADGSFVLVGAFGDTTTYGTGDANETMLTSEGETDAVVARYNADDTLAWARRDGSPDIVAAVRVGVLPDGTVLASGTFRNTTTFGAGEPNETTLTSAAAGGFSPFLVRFDPS